MSIRTLIVDDEELARERIRTLLADDATIRVVEECANGTQAVRAIETHSPDLVFLDVQMPEMDGFQVLRTVGPHRVGAVVFVTAFEKYALRAFEYAALDYLLKPFDAERFAQVLERARAHLQDRRPDQLRRQIEGLLEALDHRPVERLLVRESGRIEFVRTREIHWIEAQGNYVKIHTVRGSHFVRRSMKEIHHRLDPSRFLRVHRSTIVNVDSIQTLRPLSHGEYEILLRDGTRTTSNRKFKDELERRVADPHRRR
jgi:two-component system LytT family response regulator